MLTGERLQYLADLLPENVSWGDPLNAVMLDQILAAHSAGAPTHKVIDDGEVVGYVVPSVAAKPMTQGELPSCDVERMRAAFESVRPAVKKFHYQWDARRQRYLLDGDEDRGQYMQNEFADWCEAWCTAIAFQPMPQTNAVRDVLTRAKRMLEGYADSYDSMSRDSTSRGGDGRISCIAVMHDIRNNMVGWITAEIERLDRAKGE